MKRRSLGLLIGLSVLFPVGVGVLVLPGLGSSTEAAAEAGTVPPPEALPTTAPPPSTTDTTSTVVTTTSTTPPAPPPTPAHAPKATTTTHPKAPAPAPRPTVPPLDVRAQQTKLQSLGYWVGAVDGRTGPTTSQAVLAFQKAKGLPRSGKFDSRTVSALQTATRPSPRSSGGNLVEIDKKRQLLFVVRGGATLWVFNTSTGTEKPYQYEGKTYMADTPTGRFTVSRQVDAVDKGPLGALYRPKYFHHDGIAVHGAASVPAYPASHGCARVTNAAADFIWSADLMPIGSTVWVY